MVSAISSSWSAYWEDCLPLRNGNTSWNFPTNGKHPFSLEYLKIETKAITQTKCQQAKTTQRTNQNKLEAKTIASEWR